MNANRMKYASTPTYGMQKRGFKRNAARQTPEAPDFSKAPDPLSAAPSQAAYTTQPAMGFPMQPPYAQQPGGGSAVPYFQPPMNAPMQPTQIPFAAPTFIQPGVPMSTPQQPFAPPLGNSAPALNAMSGMYTSRAQGYVPPSAQASQPTAAQPPQGTRSAVQSAPFASPSFYPNARPVPPVMPQTPPTYGTMPQGFGTAANPGASQGFGAPQPMQGFGASAPQTSAQQQPMFTIRSAPRARTAPRRSTADTIWTVFLLGVLPALFVASLFLPGSLNALRYVFLGLVVCGLGGMWYRQMYTPSTRLAVSVGYVALCVVAVVMVLQGSNDVRYTGGGSLTQPNTAQASPAPDDASLMAAAPEVTASPTPEPTVSGPSIAEQRLELFMSLWQVNNVNQMTALVKPSWASAQEDASQSLFALLKNRTPEAFTMEDITGTEQDNSRTITMSATINKNNGKDPSVYRFMVVMVKEGGEWYVDPNSLATNDEITIVEENVVNNQGTINATAAPRQTVTPAPPADALLYYNPNNGRNYHMDQYCPAVDSSYLPLAGSFRYSELRSYMNKLTPCLKCSAPTDPLD